MTAAAAAAPKTAGHAQARSPPETANRQQPGIAAAPAPKANNASKPMQMADQMSAKIRKQRMPRVRDRPQADHRQRRQERAEVNFRFVEESESSTIPPTPTTTAITRPLGSRAHPADPPEVIQAEPQYHDPRQNIEGQHPQVVKRPEICPDAGTGR
jgi:hypothetical protein